MDVDDLYGLPLDRFVPARGALARELRKAGEREQASEVAGLRKPSVAAWAVNQLLRTQRRAMAELLEAGDALRTAQDDVLGGRGDAASLRSAVERERLAADELIEAARGLLTSQGEELSAPVIERVADTLHAAALDDEARQQVRRGRLERELRHVGLGMSGLAGATTAPSRTPARKAGTAGKKPAGQRAAGRTDRGTERAERATERAERATERAERERQERERAQARAAARATEREARRRAERAERGAQLALERRDKAAVALDEAEAELSEAEAELREAEAELREAEEAVREAGR